MKSFLQIWFFLLLVSQTIFSQWSGDPTQNTPIKLSGGVQFYSQIINDAGHGAIICWCEVDNSGNNPIYNIFAQRLDSEGFMIWDSSGVSLNNGQGGAVLYKNNITSDMHGGAIIVWEDVSDSSVFAQHIDSSGQKLWGANGALICEKQAPLFDPQIVSDGIGGAIVLWEERASGAGITGLYAQRVNSNGQLLWPSNGVTLCTSPWFDPVQIRPLMISDGKEGAIVVWQDTRELSDHIYAQRVNGNGSIIWPLAGLAINKSNTDKQPLEIINTSTGEFIITWRTDVSTFQNTDIYTQKIDTSGTILWNQNGIPICTAIGNQYDGGSVKSDNSSTIFVWRDRRRGVKDDFYGQKINSSGSVLWNPNGILLSSQNDYNKNGPIIASDNINGAIFCWGEWRNGANSDLFAQRIDSNGIIKWDINGEAISTAPTNKTTLFARIIDDRKNGAIITWFDERTGQAKVYVQRIRGDGTLTNIHSLQHSLLHNFFLDQNYPNPLNPKTTIGFGIPEKGNVRMSVLNILGEEIKVLLSEEKEAGYHSVEFNGSDLPSSVYFYRIQAGSFIDTKKMILLR